MLRIQLLFTSNCPQLRTTLPTGIAWWFSSINCNIFALSSAEVIFPRCFCRRRLELFLGMPPLLHIQLGRPTSYQALCPCSLILHSACYLSPLTDCSLHSVFLTHSQEILSSCYWRSYSLLSMHSIHWRKYHCFCRRHLLQLLSF